jgi:hypothetical protein
MIRSEEKVEFRSNVTCFHPDCDEPATNLRDVAGFAVAFCDLHDHVSADEVLKVFDILENPDEYLADLSKKDREKLYAHPILKDLPDLLP